MKKTAVCCLILAGVLLISSCGSAVPETADGAAATAPAAETTAEPALPALTGRVTLSGDLRPDTDVQAAIALDQKGISFRYEWYLDGEKLIGADQKTLRIPVSASGKKLKCRVHSEDEGVVGFVDSEEAAVTGEAQSPYSMAGLFYDVKVIGRCSAEKGALTVDWPGSGFEARMNTPGGGISLSVRSDSGCHYVVSVDGGEENRIFMPQGTMDLAVNVPAGDHTVRVIRDSGVSASSSTAFLSLKMTGEILEKPADRPLYIEYIGDSICSGSGSLGTYVSGQAWKSSDHSVTHAFSYLSAKALGADYSMVSRGGIGLLAGSPYAMPQIYTKVCGYRSLEKEYDFASARKPDLIVLELGANDGSAYTEDEYYKALSDFLKLLRAKWGEGVPIVWTGKSDSHYASMQSLIRVRRNDPDLYAFQFKYGGSGSAALATQTSGHPSAAEQQAYADALVAFLKEQSLVK